MMQVVFDPVISADAVLAGGAIAGAALFLFHQGWMARVLRMAAILALAAVLMGPQIVTPQTQETPKVVAVMVDQSASTAVAPRPDQARRAQDHVLKTLAAQKNIRVVPHVVPTSEAGETHLYTALRAAFAGVPESERGGAVVITDGLIHDLPTAPVERGVFGPVHTLLLGRPDDRDARLNLVSAPAYALVGQSVSIELRYTTEGVGLSENTLLSGVPGRSISLGKDISQTIDLPIPHAGDNIFTLSIPPQPGELSTANNTVLVRVQGVRDRLRVLLVSAEPYIGGRMWRNLLTSDPGIDLVHFTILRRADSQDPTPNSDMSLIPFPFEELYEKKLNEFDLIILDRYRANMIMPNHYLDNVAAYVEQGGALLSVSGPAFAGPDSLMVTDLARVLPGAPTGGVYTGAFMPRVNESARAHPVMQDMQRSDKWAPFSMQIPTQVPKEAQVLMTGVHDAPLLTLRRVGDVGRVAQLDSDQIWLWARGSGGVGGPYHELLRPLIHWLLKEPSLEENRLDVTVTDRMAQIDHYDLAPTLPPATLTTPTHQKINLIPETMAPGHVTYRQKLDGEGLYTLQAGALTRLFTVGDVNTPESARSVADSSAIQSILNAPTGGGVISLADTPTPDIRLIEPRSRMSGKDWIGLPRDQAARVVGVHQTPLFPAWAWLLIAGGMCLFAWVVEGGRFHSQMRG